ncbi:MAG: hypothetical protein ACRDRX_12055 [Pseudonocardiaceae bacterium]
MDGAPEAASPFPPAFRWETAAQDAPTQTMAAIGRERAQDDPAQSHDLFQPVDNPRDEPVGWPAEQPISEQPISEQPISEQQSAWLRQGPEVFPVSATQPRSKQLIGIVVLAFVVLGLVGAMVAYLLTAGPGRSGEEQIAAAQPTEPGRELPLPPAPLPPPVDTTQALIDPPGQTRGGGGRFDLPQLLAESPRRLRPSTVTVLQVGGMSDGVLKTTTTGGTTIGMFALTLPDQQAATTVAQTITTEQLAGGLKADTNRALQGMTVMGSLPGSQTTVYRAVYVLYNRTIYVEVFGSNRDAVLSTFDALIRQQVTHAPPTVRVSR